jgi:aldehyde dehydrogenase (NAD+)
VLTTSPDVDAVTFTGSTATGRRIMAAASDTIKRVFLELGGKSALVVLDDADIAGPAMMAAFATCSHAGQGCAIPTRMLVPRAKLDEVVDQVKTMFGQVTYGDPTDPAIYMGPLISERQRDKVDGMVQRAVEAGATLVTGGTRVDPGFFYTPTLLSNVDQDSEIAQNEVFGPVLAIIPHDGDDDAVALSNGTPYGLSGAVFTPDIDRAVAFAERVKVGTFGINGYMLDFSLPFGGCKQSGIGREFGIEGLAENTEVKAIALPAGTVVED